MRRVSADADARLRELDFPPERLLGLVHDVVLYTRQRVPFMPPTVEDDLASYLTEVALRLVVHYDPALSGRSGRPYSFETNSPTWTRPARRDSSSRRSGSS